MKAHASLEGGQINGTLAKVEMGATWKGPTLKEIAHAKVRGGAYMERTHVLVEGALIKRGPTFYPKSMLNMRTRPNIEER